MTFAQSAVAVLHFVDAAGRAVPVSSSNPLPGSGGGGQVEINAEAPATWDADTSTVGVAVGTGAGTACAGDDSRLSNARTPTAHTHPTAEVDGLDTALAGLDRVAAHVAVDGTDLSTLTAAVTAIRDELVAAGLMAGA